MEDHKRNRYLISPPEVIRDHFLKVDLKDAYHTWLNALEEHPAYQKAFADKIAKFVFEEFKDRDKPMSNFEVSELSGKVAKKYLDNLIKDGRLWEDYEGG